MTRSSQTIPQFTLEMDVDMGEAQRWRDEAGKEGEKRPSYTAILVRVVAEALRRHPRVNASLDGETLRQYKEINIGVATAMPEGLIVPVIRRADALSLAQIQEALDDLRDELAAGKVDPAHMDGATFTISNLGMYGVDRFQALINPPEAAILAVGRIRDLPVAGPHGLEARPVMTLRLSVDHRALDGATAAPFLATVRELLESPLRML